MRALVILLGSNLRPAMVRGPRALVQLAGELGCAGVAADGGLLLPQLPLMGQQAIWGKLTMPVVYAPLPERRPGPRSRVPQLSSPDDRHERAAAVDLVRRAMESTRTLGTRLVVLDFGRVRSSVAEDEVRALFARGELAPGEAGRAAVDAVLAERRVRVPAALDGCRSALDVLVRAAETLDVRLAILPAATPWQVPSPRETMDLLRDFAGAPLGTIWAPARLALLRALGLGPSPARADELRRAAELVEASDAVGLDYPLVLGLAEVDPAELHPPPGEAPPPLVLVTGPAEAPAGEVAEAVRLVRPLEQPVQPVAPTAAG
jgi:hypothetical protein